MESRRHLFLAEGDLEVEHHACANLEHLSPYFRHFSANVQGIPGNYFRLVEKHGRELVWTLTGIVQTVGSGNGTRSGIDAYTLTVFFHCHPPELSAHGSSAGLYVPR